MASNPKDHDLGEVLLLPLLTAQRMIGVSTSKMYQLIRDGKMVCVKQGRGSFIPRASLEAYVNSLIVQTSAYQVGSKAMQEYEAEQIRLQNMVPNGHTKYEAPRPKPTAPTHTPAPASASQPMRRRRAVVLPPKRDQP